MRAYLITYCGERSVCAYDRMSGYELGKGRQDAFIYTCFHIDRDAFPRLDSQKEEKKIG